MTSIVLNERTSDYQSDPMGRPNLGTMDEDMVKLYANDSRIVETLNALIRDDDTFKSQIMRLRMMHPEVIAFMARRGDWVAKEAVRCATTEDIALTGGGTIDGYVLVNGDRILVKDQDDATENGIWVVNTGGAWARATDADGAGELDNAFVRVLYGSVNVDTSWVVAGEDLTPGTDDINWAAFAWQGSQPGSSGSGGSLGISVKAAPYLATGDGTTDDKAAIEAAIAAADDLGGGVVYFPRGIYCISGRIAVPANIELVGESEFVSVIKATTAVAPGLDLNGDNITLRGLQFLSQDAHRFMVKSNNVNRTKVVGCWFNRAHVMLSNDTDTELVGATIEGNFFSGSYLPWVTAVNIIEVRGIKGTHIINNKMIGCISPYRFIKVQASIFYLTGAAGDQYTETCVITGNLITGQMTSSKQIIDLFHGCGKAVVSHNVMNIVGSGSGFTVFIEQKTGDVLSGLFSNKASELIISENVLCGNPTDSLIGIYGAYSLAWENGVEQTVVASRNLIRATIPGTMTRGIEFRGVHNASISDNEVIVDGYGAIFRPFAAGNCRLVQITKNKATAGQIYCWGNAFTSGGDAYTGATEQLDISGNILRNFRSDHGGIELINLVGTPTLTAIGNHLYSDLAMGTLSLIYLFNNTMANVIAIGNVGDCGVSARNRLLESSSTHTLKHEYFNSWQTKTLLEFDTVLNRVTIGDATAGIVEFMEAGLASQYSRYFRFGGFTRMIEVCTATAYLQYSYDAAGVLVDNWCNVNLLAGGRVTFNRAVDVGGAMRPTTDAAHGLGDSAFRWASIYAQGGFYSGITTKTGNNTPQDNEHVNLINCASGSLSNTLAELIAGRNGKDILVRRIDTVGANTCTYTRSSSDTILDTAGVSQTSVTLAPGELLWLRADFANARYIKML